MSKIGGRASPTSITRGEVPLRLVCCSSTGCAAGENRRSNLTDAARDGLTGLARALRFFEVHGGLVVVAFLHYILHLLLHAGDLLDIISAAQPVQPSTRSSSGQV